MASVLANHTLPVRQISSASSPAYGVGLYLHIPFCHAKCHFCDFATFVGQESKVDSYLDALETEMSIIDQPHQPIDTLFIGGGTPTVLSPVQIDRLFTSVRKYFDPISLGEATSEANPESASEPVLAALKRNGINRLSFGLQETHPHLLQALNRQHTFDDFLGAYQRARRLGYENINIDLMFGLPGQTETDWGETLQKVIELEPEHISAYALKIEEGTKLKKQSLQADEDQEADFYLMASRWLERAGYVHYEISNFAKPGFESRHNLKYWKNENTLGLGVSSASYLAGQRFKNTSSLTLYLSTLANHRLPREQQTVLSGEAARSEAVMLALRLKEGVPTSSLSGLPTEILRRFTHNGFAKNIEGRTRLTPEGWLLSNQLFQYLV